MKPRMKIGRCCCIDDTPTTGTTAVGLTPSSPDTNIPALNTDHDFYLGDNAFINQAYANGSQGTLWGVARTLNASSLPAGDFSSFVLDFTGFAYTEEPGNNDDRKMDFRLHAILNFPSPTVLATGGYDNLDLGLSVDHTETHRSWPEIGSGIVNFSVEVATLVNQVRNQAGYTNEEIHIAIEAINIQGPYGGGREIGIDSPAAWEQ